MMLRLMSNNQWKWDKNAPYWEQRGLNCSAEYREKGFADFYKETQPDVIGMQEVSPWMADRLMRELQNRALPFGLVWGRDTPIFYRTDKLELVDSDFLVYPKEVPGLTGEYNNDDTKSYSVAVFRTKEEKKMFAFMSTHLWWKSDDPASGYYQPGSGIARAYQIKIAIKKLDEFQQKYDIPQLIVGDFNTPYDSEPIQATLEGGFVHAHDVAVDFADETNGHHPLGPEVIKPYEPKPFKQGIDHILVRNAKPDFVRRFQRSMPESYLLLSDHAPVWVDVAL